ncbi:UTRA domain-containing protein [Intrasporangium calvum]|nr:UTRA domain-containing protein [Intrasporangium calvum]
MPTWYHRGTISAERPTGRALGAPQWAERRSLSGNQARYERLGKTDVDPYLGGEASITTEVLEYAVLEAPDSVPVLAGRSALRVFRRRATNGEPYAVIRTWMPAEFAAAIPSTSLENASVHERFATALQRPVTGGRRQVRAVAATPQVARQLGIAEGHPPRPGTVPTSSPSTLRPPPAHDLPSPSRIPPERRWGSISGSTRSPLPSSRSSRASRRSVRPWMRCAATCRCHPGSA